MLKIKNIVMYSKNSLPIHRLLFVSLMIFFCYSFNYIKHPFYISVVDIKHNIKEQKLNISVKLFTNDIEDALKKTTHKSIDLLNPNNKSDMEHELFNYIQKHLSIIVNQKNIVLNFIGYEKEDEAIWIYLESNTIYKPKVIDINTKLLYDFLPLESNIIHCEINGLSKSSKVNNPVNNIKFNF